MPQEYYVAQKTDSGDFVAGIDGQGLPVFDADPDSADWSYSAKVIEDYISEHSIEGVKVITGGGSNHPPKPPVNG